MVSTVVVASGTASSRAVAFWIPSAVAATAAIRFCGTAVRGWVDVAAITDGADQQCQLGGRRHSQQSAPPRSPPADDRSGHGGTEEEAGKREQRGGQREAGGDGEGEADEDDVAGHVRDEHPAEGQDADGVDDAGRNGQHEQQRRYGPCCGLRIHWPA
jgi:hypothetical protein